MSLTGREKLRLYRYVTRTNVSFLDPSPNRGQIKERRPFVRRT